MDTDVEVLKSLNKFLVHKAFTGCESENLCVTGTMAAEKGHQWIKDLQDYYKDKRFILPDGSYDTKTNTQSITETTIKNYGWKQKNIYQELKEGLIIYPFEVFCAKDFKTGKIQSANNTYTIHHFSGSWHSKSDKLKGKIINLIGPKVTQVIVKLKRKIKEL